MLFLAALLLATALALNGLKKKSLSPSGALAAFLMGVIHLSAGIRFGATLIAFYFTSSKLTRWRAELKSRLEADHVTGGARTATQVLSNSLGGAVFALGAVWLQRTQQSAAADSGSVAACSPTAAALPAAAFVGFYACCCADTWSSEVGIAARKPPRLITTLQPVPPGTNGGVSLLGLAAAASGGLLVGATFFLSQLADAYLGVLPCGPAACVGQLTLIPLAGLLGLLGSLVDSLLGATVQWSGFDERSQKATSVPPLRGAEASRRIKHISGRPLLSNSGVNVVSALLTSSAAAVVLRPWVCG